MERKCRAVIGAWECVKFGHFGARLRFTPSCDPGIFPAVPLIPALKCWCKHTALAGHVVPGAHGRGGGVTQTSGSTGGNRANEQSGMEGKEKGER